MYGSLNLKLIGIVVASVALFLAGWVGNGWRWESKYVSLQKEYADSVLEASRQARRQEQIMQSKADIELVNKNAQIQTIRTELDRALDELRKRPSRVSVPNSPGAAKGATGAELSGEDAGFLAREAARADALRSELNYCYKMYDEAKNSFVNNKQQ
jgi:hypothetical protein